MQLPYIRLRFFFYCFLLATSFQQAGAQEDPLLSDRTAETLQGLPNDDSVKTLGVADFNGDGFEDIAIARRGANPVLLVNEQGVLTNRTDQLFSNPQASANSTYVEPFDANSDGFIDLVFAVLDQPVRLHINLGVVNGVWQGFDGGVDITAARNALTIESGDINGDGTPDDLFVNQVLSANVLLINDGNSNFTDASFQLDTLRNTLNNGHFGLVDDANADGVDDIMYILADDNLFVYYNDGNGNFSNARRKSFQNTHFGQPLAYTCGCADFNGDGIFDFAVHADGGGDDRLTSFMSTGFIAANGLPEHVFVDQPRVPGRMSRRHGLPDVGDVDGDGDLDYVQSSLERVHGTLALRPIGVRTLMVINQGLNSGEFDAFVGEEWGREDSHDVKLIDVNLDGNLDMFIGHDTRYGVYINAAPPRTIELEQVASVSPGIAGSSATLAVSLVSGTNVSYLWDFGDGATATTSRPVVQHVYAQAGSYTVTVTVTGTEGSDQISFRQTIFNSPTFNRPASSTGMLYETRSTASDRVFSVAPDHDQVTVIDTGSGQVLSEIAVGDEPQSLALGEAGTLYVVNKRAASISVVNTNSLTTTNEIALPYASRPHGIVVDADSQFAYVALEATGIVVKLALPSLNVVAQLDVGPTPRELALSADGQTLYAPRFITPPLGGENTRTVSASGNAELLQINTASMSLSGQINFPANDISDTEEENGTSSRGIPNYLRAPVISPDGTRALVPAKLDNIYRGSMRDGRAREHDKLVRGLMLQFDTVSGEEVSASRFDFDNNSAPTAVAYGPTGSFVFVIHEGSRAFEVMDAYNNTVIFRTTTEFAPRSIAVSPDGTRVYIHNYLSRSVSIYDTSSLINNQNTTPELTGVVSIVSNEALSPVVLRGKQLFHDAEDNRLSTQGYISCASCHDDAGHDGRTWDFSDAGEGLRNTIDLRGRAGIRDGNVHWSANFDEFHDFENDIREIFDGTGLLSDADFSDSAAPLDSAAPKAGRSADLDALAAYGASLTSYHNSPYRTPSGDLTAAGVAGKQVFVDAGCAACHSGDGFTNSPSAVGSNIGTVDADTGSRLGRPLLDGGLDTPTLKGLWHGAPYLHDGSALNLREAVLAHQSGNDFDVSGLSNAQLDSLVSYLLQIDDSEPAPEDISTEPTDPVVIANNDTIAIDGDFSDWSDVTPFTADADDVSGPSNTLDFKSAWISNNDANLYVRYDFHLPDNVVNTWGVSVQLDTDSNPATGFTGFAGELPIGVDYMIEGSTLFQYIGNGTDFLWSAGVALNSAINGAGIELSVSRSLIGNPSTINLFFFANNNAVGGTAVDFYPDVVSDASSANTQRSFLYQLADGTTTPVTPQPVAGTLYNPLTTIVIDGDISDWGAAASFGRDPDDASGPGNVIDWREAWFAHDPATLFVAWENDEAAQLSWGNGIMIDTDQNRATGFTGFANELPIGIDILIEANVVHRYTGTGANWLWVFAGNAVTGFAGNNAELSVPMSVLGNPVAMDVFFNGNSAATGGNSVDHFPDSANNVDAQNNERFFTYSTVPPSTQPPSPTDNSALQIAVDGVLVDWSQDQQLGSDDPSEMSPPNTLDWRRAYAGSDDDWLYFAYEGYQPLVLDWGLGIYLDTDQDPTTGFRGFAGELALGADYLLEGRSLQRYTGVTQGEWSWQDTETINLVVAGNSGEGRIARATLGNPAGIDFVLRGDNSPFGGDALDFLPDTGALTLSLPLSLSNDEPSMQAARVAGNSRGSTDGGGSFGLFGLWFCLLAFAARLPGLNDFIRRCSIGRQWLTRIAVATCVVVISACSDNGVLITSNQQSDAMPQNNPSFIAEPLQQIASNNPSFSALLPSIVMDGTQSVPVVPTIAQGSANIELNYLNGALNGTVMHSIQNVTGATINRGLPGQAGTVVVVLESQGLNSFSVPIGTVLSQTDMQSYRNGEMYVSVQSALHPNGEIRGQISAQTPALVIEPTLSSLQAGVFTPTCSGCHTGVGITAPGAMNLTDADSSYNALVNTPSLQEPGKMRVMINDSSASYLIDKLEGTHTKGSQMPFRGVPLDTIVVDSIRQWIDSGANP